MWNNPRPQQSFALCDGGPMWNNPRPQQSFALCDDKGTVLAELPPTMHPDTAIGRPSPPKALSPRTDAPVSGTSTTDEDGTRTTQVVVVDTVDYYTYDRAPFSTFWFAKGDGLPKEKPPEPTTVTTTTTTTDQTGGRNVQKTVTETVNTSVVMNGSQRTATTTNSTHTATVDSSTPQSHARYLATYPYWGSVPTAPLVETSNIQTAFEAAHAATLQGKEAWVVEWSESSGAYAVVEKLEAAPKPEFVLTGNWWYSTGDEAILHAAEIEAACARATQLMFRGRTLMQFRTGEPPLASYKTAERLRDVTYTLIFYPTEYFTAQEFMRRQVT